MARFIVKTEHPIAYNSIDHISPCGTKWDSSINLRFNEKFFRLLGTKFTEPFYISDWGCAGGGFVKTCLDAGHLAVGLEGSDYSLIRKRAEWATIPDNLFCCDVTKPFDISVGDYNYDEDKKPVWDGKPAMFDGITAWEFMEHIAEPDLPMLFHNLKKHLHKDGFFVCSVSPNHDPWHVTVHDHSWWKKKFEEFELYDNPNLVAMFDDDWVRGHNQGAPNSFHFVLTQVKP